MSADRELLELAAKAAGVQYTNLLSHGKCNPLADDGDALRLAVKLGLRIYCADTEDRTAVVRDYEGLHITESGTSDPCAATRRAIVRAAAEIGRNMK